MPRVRVDGLDVNYDLWGAGPPLVLIHANPFDNTLWLYQVAHFSTYFTVVSIDVRGYGRTAKPKSRFKMEDLTKDVVAVCRHLGLRKAIFGGISVGSSILEQLVADHPEMIRALILAGTGYHKPGEPLRFAERRVIGYSSGIGYRETHMRELVTEGFQKTELGGYLLSVFLERNPTTGPRTIKNLFKAYSEWRQPREIGSVRFPVMIIVGEKDNALAGSLELHKRMPKSELVVIKDAGHACCLEKPAQFDAAVMAFLKKHGLLPAIAR